MSMSRMMSKQISSAAPRKLAASLLPVALIAFATAGAAPQASAQLLAPDDFYTPPATLPGKPGDIFRSRAVDAPLFPEANVWQIMYRSSDVNRRAVAVTGALLVPKLPSAGVRPL